MRRREFVVLLGGAAVLWPRPALTQEPPRSRRIGFLHVYTEKHPAGLLRAADFRNRLHELGWTEGGNVHIEYRWTAGRLDLSEAHADELIGARLDVIVCYGATNAVALWKRTRSIPIVFVFVSDPVGMGIVQSMGRPGGNITGFAAFEPSLGGKWLELLKEIAPGVTRASILYNPTTAPNAPAFVEPAKSAASALGISVVLTVVRDNAEIERGIEDFARRQGGGVIVIPDPFTSARDELIVATANRHHLPVIAPFITFPNVGGLASYGIGGREQARQAASYVDRILRGEKPSDLPVQHPTKFELVINLKTAKQLGLTIPPTLLARADELIE